MATFYDAPSGGFYDPAVHPGLFVLVPNSNSESGRPNASVFVPDPNGPIAQAVEISDEEHRALLDAQALGKRIIAGETGSPIATDPAPQSPAEMAADVRQLRDNLLRACDWTVLPDVPMDTGSRDAWAAYRQALRNVPGQPGFPGQVNWPTPPGA